MELVKTKGRICTQVSNWGYDDESYGECAEIVKTFLNDGSYHMNVFEYTLQYEHMNNVKYMKKVVKYINSLGFYVKYLMKNKMCDCYYDNDNKPSYVFEINTDVENGDVILGAHSLVRMIYSNRFDAIWDFVFELRDNPTLKELDNWEILQLALYTNGEKECYDYGNSLVANCEKIHKISSLKSMQSKLFTKANIGISGLTERTTFYITENVSDIKSFIVKKFKDGEYLDVYNALKVTKEDWLIAKCEDDSNKEDLLTIGKSYKKVKNVKNKRLLEIIDDNGEVNRFNKKRFKLS